MYILIEFATDTARIFRFFQSDLNQQHTEVADICSAKRISKNLTEKATNKDD